MIPAKLQEIKGRMSEIATQPLWLHNPCCVANGMAPESTDVGLWPPGKGPRPGLK